MKPFYLDKQDNVFGDPNTYRLWLRYRHHANLWDVEKGIYKSGDPEHPYWTLDAKWRELESEMKPPPGHEYMIRIELAEHESLVIQFILDDLDKLEQDDDNRNR